MNYAGLVSAFSRLSMYPWMTRTRNISIGLPAYFRVTGALLAEPMKRKKKMDPAIIRQREERKKKKLEKQIRRLEKNVKQLKPIMELEVPIKLIDERQQRLRKLPPPSKEMLENRVFLQKEWTRYKFKEALENMQMLDNMIYSQQRALDELKAESEELYLEAIQVDLSLIPYSANGPVTTPPIKNFDSPDGDYIDVTQKFDGES
ncbi:39S ribosomal protein L40, mitochondrial [Orussus abietinus]|uniref:39S ribosomal protein L40, mitochondrial n=1 Tax=Orussus abietinus TaxID=222816 RepID=UPI000626C8FB|nr:39S ribosomal protein L40, mitochondrial [Orussus abietinus]